MRHFRLNIAQLVLLICPLLAIDAILAVKGSYRPSCIRVRI
jgi:hypothetical protein